MLWTLGAPLASSQCPPYSLLSSAEALPQSYCWASPENHLATHGSRRRRLPIVRTLPSFSTPHFLHPVDSAPEGVPSSLFNFRLTDTSSTKTSADSDGDRVGDDVGNGDVVSALQAGLVEDSDLGDVSALLVEVFPAGVILADGEFSELESVIIGAPLEMTNKYLRAVAYYEVLYALKSRCGDRLSTGDFALTSDAIMLAVRDPAAQNRNGGGGGDVIAAVELTLREPDGSLPSNWPFPTPWRPVEPAAKWQPYMCNLGVAKGYRGKGFGKQLVRLCEHVAKNHWGYERMYLHVDIDDPAASGLYSSMGYKSMEQYDTPLWVRRLFSMPTIRYLVKEFKGRRGTP